MVLISLSLSLSSDVRLSRHNKLELIAEPSIHTLPYITCISKTIKRFYVNNFAVKYLKLDPHA